MDSDDIDRMVATVRSFVRDRVVPMEPRIEAEDDIPDEIRAACADMGLFGTAIPAEYGGLGTNVEPRSGWRSNSAGRHRRCASGWQNG